LIINMQTTIWLWILILNLIFAECCFSQDSSSVNNIPYDSLKVGEHKSGYQDLKVTGGANTVNAELKSDDSKKHTWIDADLGSGLFAKYYNFKKNLKNKYNIALGLDYMFLNQYASYSSTDRQAASGIFRIFGTWQAHISGKVVHGSLTYKIENRHLIGQGEVPRNLGYVAGSALSTASFKVFHWGLTNLYWKQLFDNDKYVLIFGIMDPGDWIDLFPLLNAFKYYLNEAYFNSPAMALPNQGLGLVGNVEITDNFYVVAGIHDANGEPSNFVVNNFKSFFSDHEFFTWIEAGWNPSTSRIAGETIHLTYWHQDARSNKGTKESWGWCFSAATNITGRYYPFIRAGISEGDGALMHHLIMIGLGINVFGWDYFGFGLSWGGPIDRSKRDQFGIELFYGFQLTQHLNVTPDVQITINPSFNNEKDIVGVYSVLRLRYAL